MSAALPPIPALDNTFGVALIGLLLSGVLYGITVMQAYLYYTRFPNDHRYLKWIVGILWFLDTVHLALISHAMYFYLVTNYANPVRLLSTVWSFNSEVSVNGAIGMIVEIFFGRRLLLLSNRSLLGWFIFAVVTVLAIIHFALGVFFSDKLFVVGQFANLPSLTWITKIGLGGAAACDLMICIALCTYLFRARTGVRRTDTLLMTLMVYTVNCGLLTGICAASVVITFSIYPNSLIFMALFWVLGKFYVNSLIATLNSRESLRGRIGPDGPSGMSLSFPRLRPPSKNAHSLFERSGDFAIVNPPANPQQALTIHVNTTTEVVRERRQAPDDTRTSGSSRDERLNPWRYQESMGSIGGISPVDSTRPLLPLNGSNDKLGHPFGRV